MSNDSRENTAMRPRGFELSDYLRMLRTYWLGGTLVLLLCVSAGAGWTLTQTKSFVSTASGLVQAPISEPNLAYASDQLSKSQAQSYVELGQSLAVAKRVIQSSKSSASPASLLGRVHAQLPDDTAIITVSASGPTPRAAADLADAWIAAMGAQITKLQNASAALAGPTTKFVPLAAASVPTSPASPNVVRAILLGGLVGLILGLVYLLIRNNLDRRIRSAAMIEKEFETAVLGTVPVNPLMVGDEQLVSRLPNKTTKDRNINFATSESLRELRTNLSYVHVDKKPRVIVITSPRPGDGKSTIVANLAESLATSTSDRVVVIDCDLRRPKQSSIFKAARGAGLTDVLSGRAELRDVMQQTENSTNLWIMGAGRIPPNPSELLGSNAFKEIVDSLQEHAIVLLDAPPVLAVTDAAVLSTHADGVLLVVSAKKTTHDQLVRTLALIRRGGGTVLGAVLNRVPNRGSDARDYGYYGGGQYYYYQAADGATVAVEPSTVTGGLPSNTMKPAPENAQERHPEAVVHPESVVRPDAVVHPGIAHPEAVHPETRRSRRESREQGSVGVAE